MSSGEEKRTPIDYLFLTLAIFPCEVSQHMVVVVDTCVKVLRPRNPYFRLTFEEKACVCTCYTACFPFPDLGQQMDERESSSSSAVPHSCETKRTTDRAGRRRHKNRETWAMADPKKERASFITG